MEYQTGTTWRYVHQCSKNHRHVEGPFKTKEEAAKAYGEHESKCSG